MIIGVFHPTLNFCGGAEWVGVNIVNTLKREGHTIVLLTNDKVNQERITRLFGRRANIDSQIVFPFEIFASTDLHNVYTDFVRALLLKVKCDFLIDSFSNSILPCVDATYIHFPFFKRIPTRDRLFSRLKNFYYFPYQKYEKKTARNPNRVVLANSEFTKAAIRETLNIEADILYPPISNRFLGDHSATIETLKTDSVATVARISVEKNLTIIPRIAQLTSATTFYIVGLHGSSEVLNTIRKGIREFGVSDRVHIITNAPRDRLKQILDNSKVYLHTSVGEHFGVSIVEAMARGCIPIAHNSGGPKEFVPEHLRYESPEEAAHKIEKAIDEWKPSRVRENMEIADRFSESNFSRKLLKIIDDHTNS